MKDNLIIYDITFVEYYNVNSIIDVFHGYGLKYHYFKNVLTRLPLLCVHSPHGHCCFKIMYIYNSKQTNLETTLGFYLPFL